MKNLPLILLAFLLASCGSVNRSARDIAPEPAEVLPRPEPVLARWYHSVPREPMWKIDTFTGIRDDTNPGALVSWWRDDNPQAVEHMLARIRVGYALGARRFFVNRPMGTNGRTHVPAASWLTIDTKKRAELTEALIALNLDGTLEPIHMFWFIGSELTDPRSLEGWTSSNDTFLLGETDTWEHLIASRNILGGWLSTGASGLFIDASTPPEERRHFRFISRQLLQSPFEMIVGGEAYPYALDEDGVTIRENGAPVLSTEDIEAMSWVATTDYIRHPARWPVGRTNSTWPVNPETTRMFAWFDHRADYYGNNEDERRKYASSIIEDGLIPITNDPTIFRFALDHYLESIGKGN